MLCTALPAPLRVCVDFIAQGTDQSKAFSVYDRVALLDRHAELERVGAVELGQAAVVLLGREREPGWSWAAASVSAGLAATLLVVHRARRPVERREHAAC